MLSSLRPILERNAGGLPGAALRFGLAPLGHLVAMAARKRRRLHRAGQRAPYRAAVPVVSVGNLTAGGTGKTPTVLALASRLQATGRRVAVVARGYGGGGGANDEEALLRGRLPGLLYDAAPDRPAAVRRAEEAGADILLLDDGFQRFDVARDLDIVCIDATAPFGGERCLPAGLLREPPEALADAHVLVLTHADSAVRPLGTIEEDLRRYAPRAALARAIHRPAGLRRLPDGREEPLEGLSGRPVALLSAIARPDRFAATAQACGARVVASIEHPDHHRYTAADVRRALARAKVAGADRVLVTEKDAVKLPPLLHPAPPMEVAALLIDLAFTKGGDGVFARVEALLPDREAASGPAGEDWTAPC